MVAISTGGLEGAFVRFGSLADILRRNRHVRFTPKSGHVQCNGPCPLCANSGHRPLTCVPTDGLWCRYLPLGAQRAVSTSRKAQPFFGQ